MDPVAAIEVTLQIITALQALDPIAAKAVSDFKDLVSGGATVTTADIDALISRVQSQSAQIQAIAE